MSNRSSAILIIAILVLVGFNLAELQVLITNFFLGKDLPSTQWFRVVFWIWALTALGSTWLALNGSYLAIRSDSLANRYLNAFILILCFMIKVDGKELGWSALRLSFYFGLDRFAVGVNLVGVAAYWCYTKLRASRSRLLDSAKPSDAPNRAV